MKVSAIAKAAEVTPDTVRFYTREGLLSPHRHPSPSLLRLYRLTTRRCPSHRLW